MAKVNHSPVTDVRSRLRDAAEASEMTQEKSVSTGRKGSPALKARDLFHHGRLHSGDANFGA